jgi:hypothetical protein
MLYSDTRLVTSHTLPKFPKLQANAVKPSDKMTATASNPPDLCLIPAGQAPDGRSSNLVNPASLAPAKLAVMSVLVFWATVFTAGRFCVNIRKLLPGDYFAIVAVLISITLFGLSPTQTRTDRHIWDTPACYFDGQYAMIVSPWVSYMT